MTIVSNIQVQGLQFITTPKPTQPGLVHSTLFQSEKMPDFWVCMMADFWQINYNSPASFLRIFLTKYAFLKCKPVNSQLKYLFLSRGQVHNLKYSEVIHPESPLSGKECTLQLLLNFHVLFMNLDVNSLATINIS